jgi:hypothetical protein
MTLQDVPCKAFATTYSVHFALQRNKRGPSRNAHRSPLHLLHFSPNACNLDCSIRYASK